MKTAILKFSKTDSAPSIIPAIKELRAASGLGLKEAKDVIEGKALHVSESVLRGLFNGEIRFYATNWDFVSFGESNSPLGDAGIFTNHDYKFWLIITGGDTYRYEFAESAKNKLGTVKLTRFDRKLFAVALPDAVPASFFAFLSGCGVDWHIWEAPTVWAKIRVPNTQSEPDLGDILGAALAGRSAI